jgi:hypothetical protein
VLKKNVDFALYTFGMKSAHMSSPKNAKKAKREERGLKVEMKIQNRKPDPKFIQ